MANWDLTGRLLLIQGTAPNLEEDALLREDIVRYGRRPGEHAP